MNNLWEQNRGMSLAGISAVMSPGYKIEKGKITGRLKTPWFPGTYTSAENIAALGKEAKWVGGALHIPLFTVPVYR